MECAGQTIADYAYYREAKKLKLYNISNMSEQETLGPLVQLSVALFYVCCKFAGAVRYSDAPFGL